MQGKLMFFTVIVVFDHKTVFRIAGDSSLLHGWGCISNICFHCRFYGRIRIHIEKFPAAKCVAILTAVFQIMFYDILASSHVPLCIECQIMCRNRVGF